MANPTFRSSATAAAQTGATFSVTKPAGTADGDLLVAFQATALGGGTPPATPSGWTLLTSQVYGTTYLLQVFYKVAASEGASWTFNNAVGGLPTANVYAVAAQNAAATPEGSTTANGTSGTAGIGAYSTTNANDLLLSVWAIPANAGGTITPHASYTALGSVGGATGLVNVGYKSQAATGAVSNATAALDTSYSWGSILVALNGTATMPVADFTGTPLSVTVGNAVAFTDASTNTPTSWDWDFGDGTAHGTTQNPAHTYINPGVYTVALIATNAAGSNTKTRAGYVTVTPAVGAGSGGLGRFGVTDGRRHRCSRRLR